MVWRAQVVHRLSDTVQLPPVTPCQSPEHTTDQGGNNQETTQGQRCTGIAIDVPLVQAPQVSLTTDDGDDFDVWFGRRGSIFIEERGATQRPTTFLAQQTTRNAKGQVSLAVPKPTADNWHRNPFKSRLHCRLNNVPTDGYYTERPEFSYPSPFQSERTASDVAYVGWGDTHSLAHSPFWSRSLTNIETIGKNAGVSWL